MKGQISLDYLVAIVVFIFFVVFFLFQVVNILPGFLSQMEEQRMNVEAYQISEVLINDPGSPADWVGQPLAGISRLGLNDHSQDLSNLVSAAKIAELDSICTISGQQELRSRIGTDLQFSIFITDRTGGGGILMTCTPPPAQQNLRGFSVKKDRLITLDDGRVAEMAIQVWRPFT